MSSLDESLSTRDAIRELAAFREKWKHEVRLKADSGAGISKILKDGVTRGRYSPIQNAPDDVLCEIFYTTAYLDPAPGSLSHRSTDIVGADTTGLGWIRLTHVCKRWRTLLLELSALWGKVAFTFPHHRAHGTLLTRAGSAAVDMFIGQRTVQSFWTRTMSECRPRVELLSVLSANYHALTSFCGRPNPLPNLRQLRLHFEYGPQIHAVTGSQNDDGPPVYIDAPRLEYAYILFNTATVLRGTSNRYPLPVFHFNTPALRHLDVEVSEGRSPLFQTTLHDLRWLIGLLRASPLLESLAFSLRLRISSRAPDWMELFQGPRVHLPHLKRMTLVNTSKTHLHPFLKRLSAVPPAYFSASFGKVADQADTVIGPQLAQWAVNFADKYGRHLCRPNHGALTLATQREAGSLFIQSMPALSDPADFVDVWLRSQSGLTDEHPEDSQLVDAVGLNIVTPTSVDDIDAQRWVSVLAERIPPDGLHNVEQLFLRVRVEYAAAWEEIFGASLLRPLSNVHTLYLLQPEPFHHVERSLWKDTVSRMLGEADPPLLPSLSTLVVSLEVHRNPPSVFSLRERLDEWFEHLISLLFKRRAARVPVFMLRILGCWPSMDVRDSVQAQTIRQLERIARIVDVVVDERVVKK